MRLLAASLTLGLAMPTLAQPAKLPVVDHSDLALAPARFVDQAIELRNMQCFFAKADRYRCVSLTSAQTLSVFTRDLDPESMKSFLERECSQIKKVNTTRCRFTLRFFPVKYEFDRIENYANRTVIRPNFVHIIPQPRKR